jgi:acetolactate decarboxylase
MIDHRLIHALDVERLRRQDLDAESREPHSIFQTSTLDALLRGAYDGDITFADLAARGDLGLGTLDGLDGEMIALDGAFYRAGTDGSVRSISPAERTPFAVITRFAPDVGAAVEDPLDQGALLDRIESLVADRALCYAVRVDGRFEWVRARSVPRQHPPYPPFAQVAARQVEFDLEQLSGTLVGFRFPDYTQGLNVPGYHLHIISGDRSRGGHVLDCRILAGRISVDHSSHLHMELPAGVAWTEPDTSAAKHDLIAGAEGEG